MKSNEDDAEKKNLIAQFLNVIQQKKLSQRQVQQMTGQSDPLDVRSLTRHLEKLNTDRIQSLLQYADTLKPDAADPDLFHRLKPSDLNRAPGYIPPSQN